VLRFIFFLLCLVWGVVISFVLQKYAFCRSLPRKRRRLTRLAPRILLVECILRPKLMQRILKSVQKLPRDPKLLPLLRPRCEGFLVFRHF
jgi:hypothetical protein